MEKFRIGNDLTVFWAILDDDSQPYDLSDKTVKVFLTHPRGRMELTQDVDIQGNVICWLFRGVRQRYLGVYKLTVEIFSSPTTRVLKRDIDQAFSLVSATLYVEESNGRPEINETGELTLSTILEVYQIMPIVPVVGPNGNWWVDGKDTGKPSTGMSAYEFAKENGYTGTEEEYKLECASVPALNEESRVATNEAREAAETANDAAATAGTATQKANKAASDATNAAGTANSAAENANDAATRAEKAINDLSDVATSGDYNDLKNKPVIPTTTSQLINDNGLVDEQTLNTALEDYTLNDGGYAVADGLRDSDDTIFYLPTTAPEDSDNMLLTKGSLKTINGESIVGNGDITIKGGGVSSYITDFTYRELREVAFSEGKSIECNVQLIEDALRNNIPVFVPIDTTDPSYYGYAVLEGYAEDFLYFSVKTANEIIGVDISRTASEIKSEDINKKGVIAIEEESVSKEIVGDLEVANVKGLYSGGSVYALPDAATGDEDDILLSRDTVKTINGESIVGSGDITIESGGSNIYTWLWNGSDAGFISQSEYNAIQNADAVMVSFKEDAIYHAEKIGTMLQFHIILLDEIVTYTFEFSENGDSIQWICTTTSIKNDNTEITEIKEALDEIVDEEGYLYSNGEKVDMRFTRSLLPVGTSVPANANLNTIPYLRIGKYYCSQNVDAKTVKNCPVNMAFSMEVFNPLGTNVDDETTAGYTYRLRVLTPYDTGIHYTQCCRTSGTPGTWTYDSWYVTPRSKFALASSKNDGSAAIGATNKGVYIDSNGEIKAMSYTVAKSVPSNAVFTDTNTKVTSVGNHYAPAEDEAEQITAPEGEVVTGIKRDAAGHVVGVVSTIQEVGETEYESAIADKELTTPNAVGGIAKGTKVSDLEGKTFAEMFDDLLFPTVNPTFTKPSASIAFKSYSSPQEVGATGPTSANFTTGYNAGEIKLNGVKQANRGGTLNSTNSFIYVNGSSSNKTLPTKVTLGSTTFKYRAAYNEGPQPKNNKGGNYDSPLAAGTVDSSAITLNGTYPWYASTSTATSTNPVVKQSLVAWNTTAGNMSTGQFTVQPSGTLPQVFKLPRKLHTLQLKNALNGQMETVTDVSKDYTESTETINIGGTNVTYYVYTYSGSTRGSVTLLAKF